MRMLIQNIADRPTSHRLPVQCWASERVICTTHEAEEMGKAQHLLNKLN